MNETPAACVPAPLSRSVLFSKVLVLALSISPLALGQRPPPSDIRQPLPPAGITCPQYTIGFGTDPIVPGTTDIGSSCDDCDTPVALPFSFHLYDQTYTSVNVSSNGRLDFVTVNEPGGFQTSCLPATPNIGPYDYTIFPLWHDLMTNSDLSGCASFPGGQCGVFTSVSGSAPNRVFNIEWRTVRFQDNAQTANFEVRLYENALPNKRFDVIYGNINVTLSGTTAGVQGNSGAGLFTNFACNSNLPANTSITYTEGPCESCVPGWIAGGDLPTAGIRSVGVYFPANGRFYAMGGRGSDSAGSDFTNPFEYNPITNAWTTKATAYPDNQVNNMACGVLTEAGTPYIYCVGGSAAGQTTATSRVFRYNPVADTIGPVAAPWPGVGAAGSTLPGGFTVFQNKLYILGGFNINTAMTSAIWEFTPGPNTWVFKSATLPVELGFVPTTTIGTLIFTAGGSIWDGTTLQDSNNSYVYNPVADSIAAIASIPRATAETRAISLEGKMWVLGGGRTPPNPSNEVNIYDPTTNTWTTGVPFTNARRNFPVDTDGISRVFLAGGYAPTVPTASTEYFCGGGPKALNISTRLRVQTGNNVLIGGFIITGTGSKAVVVRGIGPSLGAFGIPDFLPDPTLELHASNGDLLMQNNNWQDDPSQASQLTALGLAPSNPLESGLVTNLVAGSAYTAILAGNNSGTGIGLVEVYDAESVANSQLANISTRGSVQSGNDVMIAGFILGGNGTSEVAIRGIGPSLPGISDALADPTLELRNSNGTLLVTNDNWQDDPLQASQLLANGLGLSNPNESGVYAFLPPGAFTAILAGRNNTTGVGLVEIYNLN